MVDVRRSARFDPAGHLRQFKSEVRKLVRIAAHPLFLCFVVVMSVVVIEELYRGKIHWPALLAPAFRATWLLTAYGAAGLLMYSIILVGETYVAVFLLILSVAWLCGLTLVCPLVLPRRLKLVVPIMTMAFAAAFLPGLKSDVQACFPLGATPSASELQSVHSRTYARYRIAQEIRSRGVQPGVRVALMGIWMDCRWAKLCGIRIVAEVPDAELRKGARSGAFPAGRGNSAARGRGLCYLVHLPASSDGLRWRAAGGRQPHSFDRFAKVTGRPHDPRAVAVDVDHHLAHGILTDGASVVHRHRRDWALRVGRGRALEGTRGRCPRARLQEVWRRRGSDRGCSGQLQRQYVSLQGDSGPSLGFPGQRRVGPPLAVRFPGRALHLPVNDRRLSSFEAGSDPARSAMWRGWWRRLVRCDQSLWRLPGRGCRKQAVQGGAKVIQVCAGIG